MKCIKYENTTISITSCIKRQELVQSLIDAKKDLKTLEKCTHIVVLPNGIKKKYAGCFYGHKIKENPEKYLHLDNDIKTLLDSYSKKKPKRVHLEFKPKKEKVKNE